VLLCHAAAMGFYAPGLSFAGKSPLARARVFAASRVSANIREDWDGAA
jgi:hypothetical protein